MYNGLITDQIDSRYDQSSSYRMISNTRGSRKRFDYEIWMAIWELNKQQGD